MIALIDADVVAYRAAAAAERDAIDWGDGEPVVDSAGAASAACQTMAAWTSLAGCTETIACFTGRANFRKTVMPSYKAARAGRVKPRAYRHVVEAVSERFPTRLVDGLEGDDLLGILVTTLPKYAGAVVLTVDKDLRGVPGLHLNPLKAAATTLVTEAQADHCWLMQALTGDSTDGYTGIPGVGPKKALAILGPPGQSVPVLWAKVVAAYHTAGLTEADALVQARVARILRREDYCKQTKSIRLWHIDTPTVMPLSLSASSTKSPTVRPGGAGSGAERCSRQATANSGSEPDT